MSGASYRLGRERPAGAGRDEGGGHRADLPEQTPASHRASADRLRLFRNAHRYFAVLALIVVLGFMPGYTAAFRTAPWTLHAHGLTMLLWLSLPIAQSWLIRTRRYRWHRALGRASYALVPAALLTGVLVTRYSLRKGGDGVTEFELTAAVLSILALPMLTGTYALALYHRARPGLHARWMTAATLVTVGAVLPRYFMFVAGLDVRPAAHATYLVLELIVVALIAHDFRQRYRATPFVPFLVVHLQQHVILQYGHTWAWWRALAEVFHG
jgi:hypothetical protein